MIFIPLGLESKIFRVPWFTIAITLVSLILSLKYFDIIDGVEKIYLRSDNYLRLVESRLMIISELCTNTLDFPEKFCESHRNKTSKRYNNISEIKESIQDSAQGIDKGEAIAKKIFQLSLNDEFINTHKLKISPGNISLWSKAKLDFETELNKYNKKHSLLSNGNKNWASLFLAQFIHGGWLHYLGNFIFFIFLSTYVELKMGSMAFLGLFIVSGSVGLLTELLFSNAIGTPLMGASANVAGIAGAFTIFFWKRKVRALISYLFIFNQQIKISASIFFPLFVFTNDIVGAIANNSNVAHLAHLSGAISGSILAYLFLIIEGLPKDFLFKKEYQYFLLTKGKIDPYKRQIKYLKCLDLNRENLTIHNILLNEVKSKEWTSLSNHQKSYVYKFLRSYVELEKNKTESFCDLLSKMDPSWPLKKIFSNISSKDLINFSLIFDNSKSDYSNHIIIEALQKTSPKLFQNEIWQQKYITLKAKFEVKDSNYVQAS